MKDFQCSDVHLHFHVRGSSSADSKLDELLAHMRWQHDELKKMEDEIDKQGTTFPGAAALKDSLRAMRDQITNLAPGATPAPAATPEANKQ